MDHNDQQKAEEERIGMSIMSLLLPIALKLKGAENYLQWKQMTLWNIMAAGLLKYICPKPDAFKLDLDAD